MKNFFLKRLSGIAFKTDVETWELNPILRKELRTQLRKKTFFLFLILYIFALGIAFLAAYYFQSQNSFQKLYPPETGTIFFWTLFITQGTLVYFISASYTTTVFTKEKEAQTFENLMLTRMSTADIFNGKFYSSTLPIYLFIISSMPIITLTIFLGGIVPWHIFLAFFILYLIISINGLIGLAYSLILPTSGKAKTATYLTIIFPISTYLLPVVSIVLWALSYNKLKNYNGIRSRNYPKKRRLKTKFNNKKLETLK